MAARHHPILHIIDRIAAKSACSLSSGLCAWRQGQQIGLLAFNSETVTHGRLCQCHTCISPHFLWGLACKVATFHDHGNSNENWPLSYTPQSNVMQCTQPISNVDCQLDSSEVIARIAALLLPPPCFQQCQHNVAMHAVGYHLSGPCTELVGVASCPCLAHASNQRLLARKGQESFLIFCITVVQWSLTAAPPKYYIP